MEGLQTKKFENGTVVGCDSGGGLDNTSDLRWCESEV